MAHLKKYLRLCLNFLCSFTFFILIVQEKGACHLIKKIKKEISRTYIQIFNIDIYFISLYIYMILCYSFNIYVDEIYFIC